ncbi:MAG: ABC transporter ATP-binding protein, partial [Planctomycetes bacterium]|nr:ABC transporter ATP-binding protein [Planctomycetota bacterium]
MKKPWLISSRALVTARKCHQHFGRSLHDQRPLLVGGALATAGLTVFELLRPWPLKLVVDHVLTKQGGIAPGPLAALSDRTLLWLAAGTLLLIPLVIGWLSLLAQVALAQVGRKVTTRVRRQVCEHLQLLPLGFHHGAETGDLLVRILGDVNMVRDILFSGWIALLQRLFLFLGTLALMLWIEPMLALVALIPLPLIAMSARRSGGRMKAAVKKQRKKEGGAAALASELMRQIRVVKAYGAEERGARLFSGIARSGEKAGVVATRIGAAAAWKAEVVTGVGLATVLLVGATRAQVGLLTIGNLLVMLSYTRALYKPLRKGTTDSVKLAKAAACADRLFEVLDLPEEKKDQGIEAPRFRGHLQFEQVSHRYDSRRPALNELSFEVLPGRLCVLAGPNGSGKSTTLALLMRLFDAQSGSISIDGVDHRAFSLASLRGQFAYVPQDDLLFAGSIRENILFGRPDASDVDIDRAVDQSLVRDFVDRFPDGLDTKVGEDGVRLSGGQKRRISLARAALRDASILLLDEPLEG